MSLQRSCACRAPSPSVEPDFKGHEVNVVLRLLKQERALLKLQCSSEYCAKRQSVIKNINKELSALGTTSVKSIREFTTMNAALDEERKMLIDCVIFKSQNNDQWIFDWDYIQSQSKKMDSFEKVRIHRAIDAFYSQSNRQTSSSFELEIPGDLAQSKPHSKKQSFS